MSSNFKPAALASESTRGPSRRAKPGSRRVANRRKRRTTSLSGLRISWSEGVFRNLHQPSKGTAAAHGLAVAVVHRLLLVVRPLPLLRLVLEEVALLGARAHQLAGLGHADALGETLAGLELRHLSRFPCRRSARHLAGSVPGS